jgi:two-component system nitrogen regulation sensor histidine kinase NtrY
MVDEFSSFARMPKPEMKNVDLRDALREASFLREVSRSDIVFEREFGQEPLYGKFDSRLIAQAFGNIIKNATEAMDAVVDRPEGEPAVVKVRAGRERGMIRVDILDNGKGLPRDNRQRLLEPYMTTREKGTGLGLAIVKKIVEDHGGTLELHDAPAEFYGGRGAMISIFLPAAEASRPDVAGASEGTTRTTEKA